MRIFEITMLNYATKLSYLRRVILIALVAMMTVVACEGVAGPEGPEGPEGPIGPAGDDGSMMYAGAGAPTEDIGNIGDYYLNQETGELHGPKDSDGWGNPIMVLMGNDGQNGTKIHSGDGAPDESVGVKGDFYIDTTNQDLYGPKTDNGWGGAVDLNGEDGADGENGSQIYASDGAPDSSVGMVGDYYLDQTNKDLYGPKTNNGWGSPIDLSGEDGQDGADGSKIHSGNGPPDTSLGDVGDFYLDKSNYDLYGPKFLINGKVGFSWGSPLNLKGADGADGNANVTRYKFAGHDFSNDSYAGFSIPGVSNPDQNVWLVYLQVSSYTYPLPGWGVNGSSEYRVFTNGSIVHIDLVDGSGEFYDNIYIVRIEVSSTEDLTKIVEEGNYIIPKHFDLTNDHAVAQ